MNVKIEINIPDSVVETVVKSIMENFPEASRGMGLSCDDWRYNAWKFRFIDDETGKQFNLTKEKLLATFPLIFTDKWPKGCTQPPASADPETWEDWLCQADGIDFDAFAQLACFGEVIYG